LNRRTWPVGLVAATCAVFVVVRQFTLRRAFSPHTTEITDFGMLPEHLGEGLVAPLWTYMPLIREGGSLAFGVFCAPVFEVMGSSVFALRTANVLWHAMVLAVFAVMAWRLGRWWGVLLMGGLWTLAPPAVVELQQFGWANHLETTLLGGLSVLALGAAMGSRRWRPAAALAFAAGLAAGLATFFTYVGLSMFAAALLAAILCRLWRVGWLSVAAFGLGAGLGLLPLLQARLGWFDAGGLWALAGGDKMSFVLAQAPLQHAGEQAGPLASAVRLIFLRLPTAWELGILGPRAALAGWIYMGSLGILAALGVRRALRAGDDPKHERRGRAALLIGAAANVVVHLGACSVSGYDTTVLAARYLVPITPFVMLLACGGVEVWLRERGRVRIAAKVLTVIAAVIPLWMGMWDLAGEASLPSVAYREKNHRGYHFLSRMALYLRTDVSADEMDALIESRPQERPEYLRIVGETTAASARSRHPGGGAPWLAEVNARFADFPDSAQPWLWEGAGHTVMQSLETGNRDHRSLPQRIDSTPMAGLPVEPRIYHGFGGWLTIQHVQTLAAAVSADGAEPSHVTLPSACAGLAGSLMHQRYILLQATPPGRSWVEGCEEEWLAVGVGMQLARETLPAARWPTGEPDLRWWVPGGDEVAQQEAFLCGYEAEMALLAAVADDAWHDAEVTDPLDLCLSP